MNACSREHISGNADLSPSLVLDALSLTVFGGNVHESVLEGAHVNFTMVFCSGKTTLEVAALLDQMSPLQGISSGDLQLDLIPSSLQGFKAHLTPASRLVLLECDEVAANGIPLTPARCEGVFVLVCEGSLLLWLSFAGRHSSSLTKNRRSCKLACRHDSSTLKISESDHHRNAFGASAA